ncbi:MAG: hypothetical protein AAFR61_15825 [Bacteroidota bacterium]
MSLGLLSAQKLEQAFLQAQLRKDYVDALRVGEEGLKQAAVPDSWLRDTSFFTLEAVGSQAATLGSREIKSLLALQAFLVKKRPSSAFFWQKERALTALRFRQQIPDTWTFALEELIQQHPWKTDYFILSQYSYALLDRFQQAQLSYRSKLRQFQSVDLILKQAAWRFPEKALEADRLRLQLVHALSPALPDCELLSSRYENQVNSRRPSLQLYEEIYSLLRVKGCPAGSFRDSVLFRLAQRSQNPYMLRMVLEELIAREYWDAAEKSMARCLARVSYPPLKAQVQLETAQLFKYRKNFRTARLYAQEALRSAPQWGKPWLFQAQLLIDSAPFCAFSPLERKALNWLAIDYCERAMNVEPFWRKEALDMIRALQKELPRQEDLSLYGLQIGDSFPLGCWIGEATRVRYRSN